MSNCAIVGINWGDEGKGRMVDLLTSDYDVVVRYQGGGNAGHTVVNDLGKFALHLLPSGIFRQGVVNVLGNGVALDCENLWIEMEDIMSKGVPITPENLKISERASLVLPWHRDLDALEEARLADKKFGSTKQGIAPFYSDKFQKKTIMAGELLYSEKMYERLKDILEWKNLTLERVYGAKPYTMEDMKAWFDDFGEKIKPFICDTGAVLRQAQKDGKKILFEAQLGSLRDLDYGIYPMTTSSNPIAAYAPVGSGLPSAKIRPYVCDTGAFLRKAQAEGKSILFEAQLGALRDLDYGIYPYTTSSNTIAAFAPVGSGLPSARIDEVVGVVKAYSSCVGEGPFPCEWFGEEAEKLREAGAEYGAKTGRPRRVGPIDIVATRYGVQMQSATNIALTKLDVLSYMEKIPVCTRYEINGVETDEFPFPTLQNIAKPVIEYMDGWMCDISKITEWDKLPAAAQRYVEYVEQAIGCHIGYVSVGPERDSIILR